MSVEVYSWIKDALLFGIFSSVIIMLSPNKSYEKHISLAVGMIFILVVIHPFMQLAKTDTDTYISYIRSFIVPETDYTANKDESMLYEESIRIQLEALLVRAGYPVRRLKVYVDDNNEVSRITISFSKEVVELEKLENYLKSIFGQEVMIVYE